MARQTITPRNERQLVAASKGDLVRITYHETNSLKTEWTLLNSISGEKYTFIAHEKAKNPEDKELVVTYTCPLNKMQFDRNLGAILDLFYEETHYFGPQREEYAGMVEELKKAELWKRSISQ